MACIDCFCYGYDTDSRSKTNRCNSFSLSLSLSLSLSRILFLFPSFFLVPFSHPVTVGEPTSYDSVATFGDLGRVSSGGGIGEETLQRFYRTHLPPGTYSTMKRIVVHVQIPGTCVCECTRTQTQCGKGRVSQKHLLHALSHRAA